VANTENLTRERLEKTRDIMNRVLPDATVTGYAKHLGNITLPDEDDRHVVAAAIESGASTIVTWNTRDFPQKELNRHGLRKQRPDAFLLDVYAARPELMVAVAAKARQPDQVRSIRSRLPERTQEAERRAFRQGP
jgi:hypothetical protein